ECVVAQVDGAFAVEAHPAPANRQRSVENAVLERPDGGQRNDFAKRCGGKPGQIAARSRLADEPVAAGAVVQPQGGNVIAALVDYERPVPCIPVALANNPGADVV